MEFCQYEYSVSRKPEGVFGLMKFLLIMLYISFVIIYFAIIYITRIIPLGALIPVALWILVFFTWRYVKQDYKYEISGSILTFTVIYGGRKNRKPIKIHINEAKAILPLSEATEQISLHKPKKSYSALPHKAEPDAYALLFADERGRNCVLYFKATADALHLLNIYNHNVVIRKTAI